jgi:hypothetical protein
MTRKKQVRAVWLTGSRRWTVYAVCLGLWTTGCGWLAFHFFLRAKGMFGPEPSPAEPWWLKAHGAFGFTGLWLFGLLWGVHIVNGWRTGRRRWSGVAMFTLFAVLILSGYLLYYAGDDTVRGAVSYMHWIIGLGAPAAFFWHRRLKRTATLRKEDLSAGQHSLDLQPVSD